MSEDQLREMFGAGIPMDSYIVHDFRGSIEAVGVIPGAYVSEISEGCSGRM